TFGAMYLIGYSVDNLSLMALTIATGFIVDDAIVVVEAISKQREAGEAPLAAVRKAAGQIGFTVLTISVSLIVAFTPLLFMSGMMGRLLREFSVTLAIAIAVSALVSLSLIPVMGAYLANAGREAATQAGEARPPGWLVALYERALMVTLRHRAL